MSNDAKRRKAEKARDRRAKREAKRAARRRGGLRTRAVNERAQRIRLLIVCEGAKTEPNYLRSFPVNLSVVELRVEGDGRNTLSLIEQALEIREADGPFDEVWTVFDRDSFPDAHFNAAIARAESQDVQVAWSNEAFEVWYLLHFEYCDAALSRTTYASRLTRHLGHRYAKNSYAMYDALSDREADAVRNAKRLLDSYPTPLNPADAHPATTVHTLVERLRELSE